MVKGLAQVGFQGLADEGGFPAARDPGHAGEGIERQFEIHVLQVVAAGVLQAKEFPVARAPPGRKGDLPDSVQVVGRDGLLFQEFLDGTLGHDPSSFDTGARSHVHDIVRCPHHVLVVFHHDDRVAQVSQLFERGNQFLVVPLVEPDTGFVQNVEYAHELGADLGRQSDSLGFTARKPGSFPVEAQIADAYVQEETETVLYFLEDFMSDFLLEFVEAGFYTLDPFMEFVEAHGREFGDVLAVDTEMQGNFLKAASVAFRAASLPRKGVAGSCKAR